MLDKIKEIVDQANAELAKINGLDELEQWRVRHLGRKSRLTEILRSLGDVSADQKKAVGAEANKAKIGLEAQLSYKKGHIEQNVIQSLALEKIDVTLPGAPYQVGRLHLTTKTVKEICDIFVSMGFQVVEGPEVEWERYNFEMLNMPAEHPARDGFATLWVDYTTPSGNRPMLLRTHTSPTQPRVMEKIHDNRFWIAGGAPAGEVSWMIIAQRNDKAAAAEDTGVNADASHPQ